jgi:prepilin peptidase CpaA
MELASDWVLLAVVALAGVLDIRSRRIPNWLTVSAFAVALAMRVPMGGSAVWDGLLAALIAFAIAAPVFALGGLGGGDVKLLTAVGAFLGVDRLWGALLVTAIVGGVFALAAVIRRRRLGETIANLYVIMRGLRSRDAYTGWKGEDGRAPLTIRSAGVITRPYGVAIGAGAAYAILPFF